MSLWQHSRAMNMVAMMLIAGVALASVASGVWWLAHRPMFDLRRVEIDAAPGHALRHSSSSELRRGVFRGVRGNFFTVDLEGLRATMESVPWVRHAAVRRVWPNRLRIEIEEHRPLAVWDDVRLVNTFGEIYGANIVQAEEDGELPRFSGPAGSEPMVVSRFEELRRWLADLGRVPVALSLSPRYAWTARLDDQTTLLLGREHDVSVETRVKRWAAVFPSVQERLDRKAQVIDLRYPSGFAIRSVEVLSAGSDDATPDKPVSVAKLNTR